MRGERSMMKERKWDLDVIRVIACYLVILIHVLANGRRPETSLSADWICYNVLTGIVRCAVPFYFMLSGILFMEKKLTIRQLYQKYVLRVVLALTVWSVFYALVDFFRDGEGSIRYLAIRILSRHYHLWFLPAILGVYICLPLIQKLMDGCSRELLRYMGLVVLTVVTGKATLDPFLQRFNTAVWDSFWSDLSLSGLPVGVLYFILGYCLYRDRERISRKACLLLAVLTAGLMPVIDMFFSLRAGEHTALTGNLAGLWVLVFSGALFVLLSRGLSGYRPGAKTAVLLRTASECTFGIYLLHVFFLERLDPLLRQAEVPYVLYIFGSSALLFLVSFCVTWCIRRIPAAGSWIV